ncbi:MAG TPA: DUF1501 domain-containing protein [Rhodanobacteraceae bacterium]|jgi:uncharacterized protein (DUF1501 family)|nr:DUF1501 domain-containing protein [Rhodanobacteraceae bacterium]
MNKSFSANGGVVRARRDFLRRTACSSLACATSGALFGQLSLMNSLLAACPSYPPVDDYKALVCLFLVGGNDSFNLLIPSDTARYTTYNTSRSGPAPAGMAIDKSTLIDVHPATLDQASDTYGLHPSCPDLAALFENGNLAFVVNTGTALQPTTKTNYQTPGYPLPPQLFSHADQQGQWQYGQPAQNGTVGWAGLAADRLSVLNPGMTIPMSISLNGQNRVQAGQLVQPYSVTSSGPAGLGGYSGAIGTAKMNALEELLAQTYPDPLSRRYRSTLQNSIDWYHTLNAALANAADVSAHFPAKGVNSVADAMQEIAKIISVRATLGAKRQIFFVSYGSFDTHDGQLDVNSGQPKLFATISQALGGLYAATGQLGVQNAVTSFTFSEFARTLNSNGDGTDHAWGGIQLAVGGSVLGKKLYSAPMASGHKYFPDQTLDGPDCLARGQMIPSVSCDQYSATLAKWLGVDSCDIGTIFPYVGNFPAADLGFLA